MKNILVTAVFSVVASAAFAQNDVFFPTKEGTVQVFAQKNGKGKVQSHTRTTIEKVSGTRNNLSIDYTCELLDANMSPASESGKIACSMHIVDGLVVFDLKDFAAPLMGAANGMKVEISGTPPELAGNLKPGDKIKDANVLLAIDAGIMKLKSSIAITNAECVGMEEVTTPAGTFSCLKVVQNQSTTTMGISVKAKSTAWYARGVGMVKCDSYDGKGKLLSSNELISVK